MNERRESEQALQREARELRERQREQEQARHGVEMERNTLAVKMEAIAQRLREDYDLELDPSRDPAADAGEDGYRPPAESSAAAEIETLKQKIKRIGPVNLMALEEFEEKNERFEFLQEQRADLVRARDGLMETIRRINQEAKQRFSENFRVVRKNFIEIFTTLFEGGEADLSYTTDEDPLQADIVVTAKPKEKNISSVQLLSTGEKTLTALSLLFAIYLSRPSPFCVFDEVDAPLDDANIARFLRLVKEFSSRTQFLLITHNKKTMEVARHLYGVTMEESGVSKMVSVAFDEIPEDLQAGAAAGSAS
jgi:chromosome segregation protein